MSLVTYNTSFGFAFSTVGSAFFPSVITLHVVGVASSYADFTLIWESQALEKSLKTKTIILFVVLNYLK